MQKRDVVQLSRVKHLGYRAPYPFVELMRTGVDKRRTFVVDQELVERDPRRRHPGRDAIDPSDDAVHTRTRLLHVDQASSRSAPGAAEHG
jgi:hypothetical protein